MTWFFSKAKKTVPVCANCGRNPERWIWLRSSEHFECMECGGDPLVPGSAVEEARKKIAKYDKEAAAKLVAAP